MFSAIGEILSRIAMQVTIDRLKVAVQTSLKLLGADRVGCVWQINIEDPSYSLRPADRLALLLQNARRWASGSRRR